jgi:hypothetical protein
MPPSSDPGRIYVGRSSLPCFLVISMCQYAWRGVPLHYRIGEYHPPGTRNGPAIDGRDGLFAARGSEPETITSGLAGRLQHDDLCLLRIRPAREPADVRDVGWRDLARRTDAWSCAEPTLTRGGRIEAAGDPGDLQQCAERSARDDRARSPGCHPGAQPGLDRGQPCTRAGLRGAPPGPARVARRRLRDLGEGEETSYHQGAVCRLDYSRWS